MKRFFLFALAATAFAACSTDTTQDLAPEIPVAPDELQVSFDEEDTRIQLGENGSPVWNENDLVSVFYKSDGNDCYKFTGKTGDREGTLKRTSVGEWSRRGDNVVVVYPYNKDYLISLSTNTVEASLPAEQTYAKNSYGIGSSLMIATGDYKQFALKNVCGWLKLQFAGTGYVSKIVLRGNNGEQVAGNMLVCADDASCILAEASADIGDDEVGGALIADDDILTSVTLNCGDGVALNSETPTAFYIALPPQTFEKGLTATMYGCDGSTKEISTDNPISIERNHILPMASATLEMPIPSNQIWYTSSDGNVIEPNATDVFGANIVSNTYENGQGVITFDGEVTTIGKEAFKSCSSLTSISIPKSVTSIKGGTFSRCSSLKRVDIADLETWCRIDFDYLSASNPLSYAGNLYLNGELVEDLVIPESITEVGWAVFFGAKCLKSVTFHNRVTSIEGWAFNECTSLTSVTIPDSVTAIGFDIFSGCDALKAFYGKFASADNRCLIMDGVLKAFAPAGLTEYTILDRVTEIGRQAFIGCRSLTSVTIPDSVTSIGNQAFNSSSSLKEVYCMPTTPPSLDGSSVFDNNASGRKIYVPAVSLEAYKAAEGWKEYADYIFPMPEESQNNKIFYTSSDGNVVTPNATDVFGANIVSNTYENGQGVITFDGEVTTIGKEAFKSCKSLTSVTIPDSVTTIGEDAFYKCSSLTSVTIGNGVSSIGHYAFHNCTKLTRVDITDLEAWCRINYVFNYGITAASNPLYYAGNLYLNGELVENLVIPESITELKEMVFLSAKCLKSVTFHNRVTSIERWAFKNCSSLESITIPESVTSIQNSVFSCCDALKAFYGKYASADNRCLIMDGVLKAFAPAGLTEYTILDRVTTIENQAFTECTKLTSVTIPDSVTSIGIQVFNRSSSLKEVYCMPTTPPSLGGSAFNSNASDRKIYVPAASLETYKAAEGWKVYADYIFPLPEESQNNKIFYTSSDGNVIEPYKTDVFGANIVSNTYTNGQGVIVLDGDATKIGSGAFWGSTSLTNITIPDSVTTIGDVAFHDCSSLTSVTIPDGVTTIGNSAFDYCTSLTSVTIPDSVTSIGEFAFSSCSSLTSITIPDSVISIEKCVFKDCSSLKSVIIPDSVTSIENNVFVNCTSLTSVTIPDSVTTIGNYAFDSCSSLTSITIPDSVTTIGKRAFSSCSALKSITIPDSVTTIGESVFWCCTALTNVTIPDSVTEIGELTFFLCSALTNITIPDSVTTIGNYAFDSCSSLTSITIPDSVTTIGKRAFSSCSALKSITIPDSVTTIGDSAFEQCDSLTSVTIGDSVTTIGNMAFLACSSLKEVYCKPTTPPSLGGSYVFDYNASGRRIYVPTASVDAYKTADGWSEYASAIYPYTFTE